jgi:phenylacetate-CoA ligase
MAVNSDERIKTLGRARPGRPSLRTWALRTLLIPMGDRVFGSRVARRLRFLEKAQWWDADRILSEREGLLKQVIRTAYEEVPFYRDSLRDAGLKPEDIRTPADLRRLPLVTKQMLIAGYPAYTTRRTGQRTYESFTSGSTGTNFRVLEDAETAGWYRSSYLLALQWSGFHVGDPHVQTGMNLSRSLDRRLKDWLARCHYVSAFELGDPALDAILDEMDRRSIKFLFGYPASLFYLAGRARQRGWNGHLTAAVTWGDTLYPVYRNSIESAFGTRVFDTYGCAEGMQIAAQCGFGRTYHIHALDVVAEFVDDAGQPVREGERGNLVLTRLHAGPMPFIRYRIGDVGRSGKSRRCECGRGFEVMESVEGRETDIVITPSGNRLIVHFFTGILEYFAEIDSFQVIQERPGEIVLRVVPRGSFSEANATRIVAALQEHGAHDLEIHVQLVDHIPVAATGKRRFVIGKLAEFSAGRSPDPRSP